MNHLGDTLLMTPTIRFLREKYPDARIDVLVRSGCEAMLHGNPDINHVIPVARPEKTKRTLAAGLSEFANAFSKLFLRRYDYAFDLSNSDRAKFWIALSCSKVRAINKVNQQFGWKRVLFNQFSKFDWTRSHQVLKDFRTVAEVLDRPAEPGPLVFRPQASFARIGDRLPWNPEDQATVVIHPTTRWPYKQWLPERWAAVADEVSRSSEMKVLFSCGLDTVEIEHVEQILNLAKEKHGFTRGRISLDELAWVLGQSHMYLGVDTVAMHLSAAMGTPTIGLFGKSRISAWGPWNCPDGSIQGECFCRKEGELTCRKDRPYRCMESITESQVMESVRQLTESHEPTAT